MCLLIACLRASKGKRSVGIKLSQDIRSKACRGCQSRQPWGPVNAEMTTEIIRYTFKSVNQ
jgi:hypothetical protein